MSISRQASRCQQAFSKPCLVNLISKDTHQYSLSLLPIYDGKCSYVYTSASLTMSTSILKALPGKLDIKRHSPVFSISSFNLRWKVFICLYLGKLRDVNKRSQSLAWLTCYQKTLTSILYLFLQFTMESVHMSISRQALRCQQAFSKPCLVNLISKDTHLVFSISRQTSRCQQAFSKPCLVNLISKDTHLVFSISRQALRCQQAFSKPYLVNLISKDTHLVFSISSFNLRWKVFICLYLGKLRNVNKHSQSLAW